MAKENTIITRIPKDIYEKLDKALQIRFKNNLISRKDLKMTEGFRLLNRTPEFNLSLERIKLQPKKEDIKRR